MRAELCFIALVGASAIASPVLDQLEYPRKITAHQHNHLERHLLRARHKLASRAILPTDHSNESPEKDILEKPPVNWNLDEHIRLPELNPESQAQAQTQAQTQVHSPVTTVVVTAFTTICSLNKTETPSTTSSTHHVTTITLQAQNQVSTAQQAAAQSAASQKAAELKSAADKAAAEQASAKTSTQQQQQSSSQSQTKPQLTTQQQQTQQQPPPQTQPKPQPTQQQQQQQQPPTQKQTPQETQSKPQPTQQQPEPSSSSASDAIPNNLPTEFVPNLDPHSEIYKGLSQQQHDVHRKNHSMPPLAWNQTLFEYAKETAESCIYGHNLAPGGGGYGQNIASGIAPGNITAVLSNMYYNAEIGLFFEAIGKKWGNDNPDMSNFELWGHVTQMLWSGTTSHACYTATCSPPGADPLDCDPHGKSYLKNVNCGNGGTKAYNTVCNYHPPGNYPGKYSAVLPPKSILGVVQMTTNGIIGLP